MISKTVSSATLLIALTLGYAVPALAASTPIAPVSCIDLQHDLTVGARDTTDSTDVAKLQTFLVSHGYLATSATGYFGSLTRAAVARLQTHESLAAHGFAGTQTRTRITALSCPSAFTFLGAKAPHQLAVGEKGTWVLGFTVPAAASSSIQYGVTWGDESTSTAPTVVVAAPKARTAYAVFSHTYQTAGSSSPVFTAAYGSNDPIRVVASVIIK